MDGPPTTGAKAIMLSKMAKNGRLFMKVTNKLVMALSAMALMAGAASAERYVMVTHGEGKDPFWPVVQKGGEDAARHIGADFEYVYTPSADMGDMAKSIAAAAATQPDGLVVSLPDPEALGQAIKDAVASGVPVITMNSGLESSASVGALMHVGQPEYLAGQSAGARAKAEGATNALCMMHEQYNTALNDRCNGYGENVSIASTVDTTSDPATITTRAAAALQANPGVDAVLSVGPHTCVGVQQAIDELGMTLHHSCFDLSPPVMDAINAGKVAFTIDQQQRLQGYMPIIVLHADRIRSGLLTDDFISSRAKSRGVSESDYMAGNLLNKEVTAEHVADAFTSLACAESTTGHVMTVDGGNIEASLR
jgi:simple sugar transport system substrate-binding protein